MFFYQSVHSSKSILGVRENFHSIYPLNVYTFCFQKLVMISKFFQRKVGSYLFSQACCFLARQLFFILIFFVFSSFFFFSYLLSFPFPLFSFLSYLSFVHFFLFLFLSKRSCGPGRILPTYV